MLNDLFTVVHEDENLLVINKPAGLVCHPTKNGERSSLIGRTRLYLPEGSSTHLVNRLDRETSGLVVVAKNSLVAGELGKILEARAMQKEYHAIVHGHVPVDKGLIDQPLGRDEQSTVAVKDRVRPDGAAAQTEFIVEHRFENAGRPFSLLKVLPRTGRKHQIRIHLAFQGHPIVGDKLYGGDEDLYLALVEDRLTAEQRGRLIFEHHALHADTLRFEWRDQLWNFTCEPEPWFTQFYHG
jgi:23S rRNA pseudouridine1911/1915/1917 synthase